MKKRSKISLSTKRIIALLLSLALVWPNVSISASAAEITGDTLAGQEIVQVSDSMPNGSGDGTDVSDNEPEAGVVYLEDRIPAVEKTKTYISNTTCPFDMDAILEGIVVVEEEDEYALSYVSDQCTFDWQMESEGSYVSLGEDVEPTKVGNYKLVVNMPVEGQEDASIEILFAITKLEAAMSVSNYSATSGMLVSEMKDNWISSVRVTIKGNQYSYVKDNPLTEAVDESEDSDLDVSLTVTDMLTGNVLAEDAALTVNEWYQVDVAATFTDNVSAEISDVYEITTYTFKNIYVAESEADVKVTLLEPWSSEGAYYKVYDGTAIAEPQEGVDYTLDVTLDYVGLAVDGDKIPDAQVTGAWYNDEMEALAEAPVDAGNYYYVLSVSDEAGIYEGGVARISVEIQPRELVIKPQIKSGAVVYSTMTAGEAVYQIADYVVWDVAADKEMEIDRTRFFGTYLFFGRKAYYEPGFDIYEVNASEGTAYMVYAYANMSADKSYELRFSGDKEICSHDGYKFPVGISEGNCPDMANYIVKTDSDTLKTNTAAITVVAAKEAVIDVSAILQGDTGSSLDNPIKKVYDGLPIYESKADFRKAVVHAADDAENVLAKDIDAQITYQWYSSTNGTNWSAQTYSATGSPVDAMYYKLRVTYYDATSGYAASMQEIYYEVVPQKMKVVPVGIYEAWTTTPVDDFNEDVIYEFYTVPDEGESQELFFADEEYSVQWEIQKADVSDGDAEFTSAHGEDFDENYKYQIAITNLSLVNDNYVNYTVSDGDMIYLNDVTAPINLKSMGETELEIVVNEDALASDTKVYDGEVFDIMAALDAGLVKLQKLEDGAAVTDADPLLIWYDVSEDVVDAPVNVGTYTLRASYAGDEQYSPCDEVDVITVEITMRETTPCFEAYTPLYAGESIVAFTEYWTAYYDLVFDNMIPADQNMVNPSVSMKVYDAEDRVINSGVFKLGETYTVYPTVEVNDDVSINYAFAEAEPFTVTADMRPSDVAASKIEIDSTNILPMVALQDEVEGLHHTITFKSAIPYLDVKGGLFEDFADGNYVGFVVTAPENMSLFDVGSYIEKSLAKIDGGCNIPYDFDGAVMEVLIPVTELEDKEFSIYWADGFVETFTLKLSEAQMMPNLFEAVSPKSLSFVSPVKKMYVGDEQQLDVKVVKQQMSDIICLGYESSDPEVLRVNESGEVYAVKPGKATITVFAAKDVNGELVPIPKGKKASVKITVSNVTAPKITTAKAYDDYVSVAWKNPGNGSAYDVYVLEGKKKATDFETAFNTMKDVRWEGIFAAQPEFALSGTSEYAEIKGLKPNTQYTVCVVNKSQVYDENGDYVYGEYTAASVKTFKTTKTQLDDIEIAVAEDQAEWNDDFDAYIVEFSQGKLKLSAIGYFDRVAENAANDDMDLVGHALPLSKALQKNYVNPKLTYSITNGSDIASVDKKGNITLKGAGYFTVTVKDTISGERDTVEIYVDATPDAVKGKTAKLKVGQTVALEDLLTYQQGKKTVNGDIARFVQINEELIAAFEGNEYFKLDVENHLVTVIKGGGKLKVKLTDEIVADNGGKATADVVIQSQSFDAVKKLKVANITDIYFDVQFEEPGYAEAFKIEVTDARGSLIESVVVEAWDVYDDWNDCYSYRVDGLTQRSKYKVTVTAMYGKESSKAASKVVTTTKMPASYISLMPNVDIFDTYDEYLDACWNGVNVRFCAESYGYQKLKLDDSSNYVDAGNTYTLELCGSKLNYGAIAAGNDKLTWTSSNPKVAKVKATEGAGATLTTLKSGYTMIEVKSKITKAVITRFWINVRPVGNGNEYYGENELLARKSPGFDGTGGIASLAVNDSVAVTWEDGATYKWFVFTAPEDGDYVIAAENYDYDDAYPFGFLFDSYHPEYTTWDQWYENCLDDEEDFEFYLSLSNGQSIYLLVTEDENYFGGFDLVVAVD